MAKAKLSMKDGLFELKLASKKHKEGDLVTGTATALVDSRKTAKIALAYMDQSHVPAETAGEIELDGIEEGASYDFEFRLPEDPLASYEAPHGYVGWCVRATIKGWSGPRDAAPIDVECTRAPSEAAGPVKLDRPATTWGFAGRGRKAKKWDVHATVAADEVARGGTVEVDVEVGAPAPGREIEIGLGCWEHWTTSSNVGDDDDDTRQQRDVVYEDFVRCDASSGGERVTLKVPRDAPFSWDRPKSAINASNYFHSRFAGFTWKVIAREGEPGKGPEKEAEILVHP